MALFKYKGNRIRASDQHLVYRFCMSALILLFLCIVVLLNLKQIVHTDWENFNLSKMEFSLSSYNFITILIAAGVCALVAFLYVRFCYDSFKKMVHRQKLARMILENKWYEAEQTKQNGFFTDLPSSSKEKIVWFPKIYYQMKDGLLHIQCEISMGKYQEQLLNLEDKLESGLYCEMTDKVLHDGYIEYTLLYDMVANRISIEEVKAEHGGLKLMKNLIWEYDALPHALIAGGTGGGKTYFLLTIIETLLQTNAVLFILDPKNADLADLGTVMKNVYHTKEDMIACVIVQNPTLAPMMETSDYEPKAAENDSQVDADTVSDATAFLETFFKLYPTATEKELAYYVEENVIEPVQREYQFAGLINPVFIKDGENIKVNVSVKYLDNLTRAEQISQRLFPRGSASPVWVCLKFRAYLF